MATANVLRDDLREALDAALFAQRLGFDPDPWQSEFLRHEGKRLLLACARQTGKSATTAVKALHRATHHAGSLVLIVCPSIRQAAELYHKVRSYARIDDNSAVETISDTQSGFTLDNGSRVIVVPATSEHIRAFSVDLLIIDEASWVPDAVVESVVPMLSTTDGTLCLLSTPAGKRGYFYRSWASSQKNPGEPWTAWRVRADECRRVSAAFLAQERASLPAHVYWREYESEFLDAEGSLLGGGTLAAAHSRDVTPLFSQKTPSVDSDYSVADDSVASLFAQGKVTDEEIGEGYYL